MVCGKSPCDSASISISSERFLPSTVSMRPSRARRSSRDKPHVQPLQGVLASDELLLLGRQSRSAALLVELRGELAIRCDHARQVLALAARRPPKPRQRRARRARPHFERLELLLQSSRSGLSCRCARPRARGASARRSAIRCAATFSARLGRWPGLDWAACLSAPRAGAATSSSSVIEPRRPLSW